MRRDANLYEVYERGRWNLYYVITLVVPYHARDCSRKSFRKSKPHGTSSQSLVTLHAAAPHPRLGSGHVGGITKKPHHEIRGSWISQVRAEELDRVD